MVVPVISLVLVWFPGPGQNPVFRHSFVFDTTGPLPVIRFALGPWGVVFYAYNLAIAAAALILVFRLRLQSAFERRVRLLFLAACTVGGISNLLYVLKISPAPGINYGPVLFPITSTLIAFALVGNRMLDLAPVARASLIERLDDRLIVLNGYAEIIDLNQSALNTLGLSHPSVIGQTAAEALKPWPELLALLNQDKPDPMELTIGPLVFEGSVLDVNTPIVRTPRARILILRDITRRKEIENQLRLAKDSAEAADKAQARFLATMSHEIRTPMNGIFGFIQMLNETELSANQREHIDIIAQSSRSLLVIVNDVLDYSKITAGRMEIERVSCNIAEIARQICRLLEAKAHEKNIGLTLYISPGVPKAVVGDPVRIGQVLTNLIGNALKFTEQGGVDVDIGSSMQNGRQMLVLKVKDTGIGIPSDKHKAVFEPFSQADASTTRRFGGTGLGLSITSNLCVLMGGSLTLESEPGKGSVFTATIDSGVTPVAARIPAPSTPVSTIKPTPHPLRILVFEDNAINQTVMRALLARLGHQAQFVANGEEGLVVLARETFDVALMDIEMPVMDGYEAVRNIRKKEAGGMSRLYIIAVTAHAVEGVRERCLAATMDDFLTKPVNLKTLGDSLSRVLPLAKAGLN